MPPPAMKLSALNELIKDSCSAWLDDYAPSMGAALAYYTIFSIAPLLIIVIAVAGLFFGEEAARGEILTQMRGLIGDAGAAAVQSLLQSASAPPKSILATAVGIAVLLLGATTVFAELQDDLDRIWRVPTELRSGLWNLLRQRLLSFGMILGVGFLLLVSLIISAVLSALGDWWGSSFSGWALLLEAANFGVSVAVVTLLFAMIYKILPRLRIAWRDVWIGAGVTALLFTIGKTLIGVYLGKSGIVSTFGAAGSVIVLLVWVYYSAQIFLLGAEFTSLYAYRYGSRRSQQPPAAAEAAPTRSD